MRIRPDLAEAISAASAYHLYIGTLFKVMQLLPRKNTGRLSTASSYTSSNSPTDLGPLFPSDVESSSFTGIDILLRQREYQFHVCSGDDNQAMAYQTTLT